MAGVPPSRISADQNLLFGILALQMDFVSRDQLVGAMNAWVLEKHKPLGQVLLDQKALTADTLALLNALMQKHLALHKNDAAQSLAAVSSVASVKEDLQRLADPDLAASLGHLSKRPDAGVEQNSGKYQGDSHLTRSFSAGTLSSSGTRFRVVRPHAKGGLGQVSVAVDEELSREVALKEIQLRYADDAGSRLRFMVEAEITGRLEHPNIVPVYGLGNYQDGRPFYAMRFIRGDSLKEAIQQFHAQPGGDRSNRFGVEFRSLLGRFIDVCNAVAYAHSRGILHRDLKPGNIMLGSYGETLVVDWGLAKPIDCKSEPAPAGSSSQEPALRPTSGSAMERTVAGSVVGTPEFMSPEQAAGRLDLLGPATDVYSLGATLYCLLTGKSPFDVKDTSEILRKVQRGDLLPPRHHQPNIPKPLEAICLKAMALKPEARYSTPRHLADEIERWLADEPVAAWQEPWQVKLGRWTRRHKPLVSGAAAAIVVALLAGTAGLFWHQQQQNRRATELALRHQSIGESLEQTEKARRDYRDVLGRPAGVFGLLNEPERWKAQIQVARASLERAKGLVSSGAGEISAEAQQQVRELEDRLNQDESDRRTAVRLEKIRIDRATGIGGRFDNATPAREYPLAFADAGLPVEQTVASLAERIRASSIQEQLVAALDDWAFLTVFYVPTKDLPDKLLAIARGADQQENGGERVRHTTLWKDPAAVEDLSKTVLPSNRSPQMLALVARLMGANRLDREDWLRKAHAQYPADFWLNYLMANTLMDKNPLEAAGFCRAALAVRPLDIATYNNLGNALRLQQRWGEAIAAFGKTVELDPKYVGGYLNLGIAHYDQKDLPEAVAAFRKAIALDPGYVPAHNNLGNALREQKLLGEALDAYRKAIELDPDYMPAHHNLGQTLQEQGRLDDAIAAYQRAIELAPREPRAHGSLGVAYHAQKRFPEAIRAFKKAVELDARSAPAYLNLGVALRSSILATHGKGSEVDRNVKLSSPRFAGLAADERRFVELEAAYRKALEVDPKLAAAYGGLGEVLLWQGSFVDAAAAHQKALELLPAKHGLRHANERYLQNCRRFMELEAQLPAVLAKKATAPPSTLVEMAQMCQNYKKSYAEAAQLYQAAFADGAQGGKLASSHRYAAACAAVLAARGHDLERSKLSAEQIAILRRQARDWLRADVDAHLSLVKAGKVEAVKQALPGLTLWQHDPDLANVRDSKALEQLPSDEQQLWRQIWSDVDQLVKRSARENGK